MGTGSEGADRTYGQWQSNNGTSGAASLEPELQAFDGRLRFVGHFVVSAVRTVSRSGVWHRHLRQAHSWKMGKSVASLPDSAVDLIRAGAEGHMVTLNPDGSPQLSLVWVAATASELRVASLTPRQKLRNIRRDDRVAISFQSPLRDAPGENGSSGGMRYYLVIKGRAVIEDGGAPQLLRELAATYLGPGVKFPRGDSPPEGWVIRLAIERWHGYGPWGDGP